jgi:probable phosphoglycerate mutase
MRSLKNARHSLAFMPASEVSSSPRRRRIYLMRHGSVTYHDSGAKIEGRTVALSEQGRIEASAAGIAFAHHGVLFDRVITSGLKRTVETAKRVLSETRQRLDIEIDADFEELKSGDIDLVPTDQLYDAVVGAFRGVVPHEKRFTGGESIGELFARVTPALERLVSASNWNTALLVLHGGVNRAILSLALTGQQMFLGNISQAPASISAIDVGLGYADWVVRYAGIAPTDLLQPEARLSTLEAMLETYIALKRTPS